MSDKSYESAKSALKTNIDSTIATESAKSASGYETAAYQAYSGVRDSIKGLSKIYKKADAEMTRDYDALMQLLHYSAYQASAMKDFEAFAELSEFISSVFGGSLSIDDFLEALKTLYAQYQKEEDADQKELIRQKILALIDQYYGILKRLISELGLLPDDAEVRKTDDGIEVVSDSSMTFESGAGKEYAAWKGELNKSGWIAQSSTIYAKSEFDGGAASDNQNPIRISIPLVGWNDVEYKWASKYWMWQILWWKLFNATDYSCTYQDENDGSDSSNTSPTVTKESKFRIGSVLSGHDSIYSITSEKQRVYITTDSSSWSNGYMRRLGSEDKPAFSDKSVQIQCEFDDGAAARKAIAAKDAGRMFASECGISKVDVMHTLRFSGDDKDTVIKGTLEYDADLTAEYRKDAEAENEQYPAYFKQLMHSILKDGGKSIIPYTLTTTENGNSSTTTGIMMADGPLPSEEYAKIEAVADDDGKITKCAFKKADETTVEEKSAAEDSDADKASISNAFGGEDEFYSVLREAFSGTVGAVYLAKTESEAIANKLTELYDSKIAGASSGWYFTGTVSIEDESDDDDSDDSESSSEYSNEYAAEAGISESTSTDISAAISSVGTSGSSTAQVILCIKPSSSGSKDKVDITCEYDPDADVNKTDYGNGSDGLINAEDKMLFGGEFSVEDADITSSVVLDTDEELLAAYLLAIGLLDPGSDDFDALLALIFSAIEKLKSKLIEMLKEYLTKINGAITSVTSARTIYGSSDPNYESEYMSGLIDMYSAASSDLSNYLATDGFDLDDIYDGTVYNAINADLTSINDEYADLFDDAEGAISTLKTVKGSLFPISDAAYGNDDFSSTATIMYGILKGTNASYATAASSDSAMLMFSSISPYQSWHSYFQRVAGQINRYGRTADAVSKDIADGRSTSFESLESYEYLDVPSAQEALLYAMSRIKLLTEGIGSAYSPIYDRICKLIRKTSFDIIVDNSANDRFMITVNPKLASAITEYSNEIGDPAFIEDPNDMPINPALSALYPGASAFNEYDLSPASMKDDDSVGGRLAAKALAYKLILANGAGSAESDYAELMGITGLNGLNVRDYYLIYALLSAYKELADAKLISASGVSSATADMKDRLSAALTLGKYAFGDDCGLGELFTDQVNDSSAYLTAVNGMIDANLDSDADFESIRYRLDLLGFGSLQKLSSLFDANVITTVTKIVVQRTPAITETPLILTTPKAVGPIPAKITKTAASTNSVVKAAASSSSATKCITNPISTSKLAVSSTKTTCAKATTAKSSMSGTSARLSVGKSIVQLRSIASASTSLRSNASSRFSLLGTNGESTNILPVRTTLNSTSSSNDATKSLINATKALETSKTEVYNQLITTSKVTYGDDLGDLLSDDSDIQYDETMISNAWAAFDAATKNTNVDGIKKLSDGSKYAFVRITQDEFTKYMSALFDEYARLKSYLDDDERTSHIQMRKLFGTSYPAELAACEKIEQADLAELNSIGADSGNGQ